MERDRVKGTESVRPYIDSVYDGSIGRIRFSQDGSYEIGSGGTVKRGRYAFFTVDGREVLELRAETRASGAAEEASSRETYLVERIAGEEGGESISLSRIRIGSMGIRELHETAISLKTAQ
jgi:hypothetical protein